MHGLLSEPTRKHVAEAVVGTEPVVVALVPWRGDGPVGRAARDKDMYGACSSAFGDGEWCEWREWRSSRWR